MKISLKIRTFSQIKSTGQEQGIHTPFNPQQSVIGAVLIHPQKAVPVTHADALHVPWPRPQ